MYLLFSIVPFFSTCLGGWAALRLRHRLHPIMGFASGVLVATALADLLPEANEQFGDTGPAFLVGIAAVCGFLLFSVLEAFVHQQTWEHGHPQGIAPDQKHEHDHPSAPASALGIVGPLGLIVHSLLDGVAIGLAFRAGGELGLIVGLAVMTHDFADGMNVVTLALTGGRGHRLALLVLGLDAIAPVVGAVSATQLAIPAQVLGLLLATFAGLFLAIGAGHLLPEAQHRNPGAAPSLVLLAGVGAAIVVTVRLVLA